MNTLDLIILILLLFGFIRGLFKGFFVEIASLLALILGIYGAIHFSEFTATYLNELLSWNKKYIAIVSFILTFIIIVIAITLLGKLFTKMADFASLGWVNKLVGGLFGCLKMALIVSVLLIYFSKLNTKFEVVKESSLQESIFYKPIKDLAGKIFPSYF